MILCCGEALIDMIPTPTNAGRDGFVPHAGGAVFNTAIGLGRLGTRVGMLTGISTDMFGQQLSEALRGSHVEVSHVITSERPTTLAFVRLADGHATYSFYDENSAGRMLSPDDLPEIPGDISALFFGGISLACEPGATAYQALLDREGDTRAVMIDPNIRPGFIENETRYRARLEAMLRLSDIVKVSDEDLNWIEPAPPSLREKIDGLLDKGPALVIVTRGGDGAVGYLPDGAELHVPVKRVQIVDTVGAGDTFNAGVLAKLSELGALRKPALRELAPDVVRQALTHGTQVAAVTVSRAGANPPWAEEL
ncbi:carbohydrate kinase [Sedimentimonas flavescens]|uniref:Carbohydrate kinase n=1 Tax=Sedimentimonas flavescens TaxID=2851012 RepID=A0ABT3A336_9RHOB|nr:carbohydrate kinase [Sedimentimonas flavescens]MBW0159675.1 carbohydrate kinase [Sedimentimonas flavescens]MCV2880356.1 carbohydrate kinase [Sedimentimonas flavescens]